LVGVFFLLGDEEDGLGLYWVDGLLLLAQFNVINKCVSLNNTRNDILNNLFSSYINLIHHLTINFSHILLPYLNILITLHLFIHIHIHLFFLTFVLQRQRISSIVFEREER